MELYFLGTGAGMPSKLRNVTSIALRLHEERGTFWLFDCGEGTQHRIMNSPLKLSKLEKLFITHLHGDHIYGIPGLLSSRSYQGGVTELSIYGPSGIKEWIYNNLSVSHTHLSYSLNIIEISEDIVFADNQFTVSAALLEHRIPSYGYRLVERDQDGSIDAVKLQQLGIKPGPLYGQLKKGHNVQLPDGSSLQSSDFVTPPHPGRKLAILGDTKPCGASLELSRNVSVLVHEATFAAQLAELANEYGHSTAVEAAQTALIAGASALVITHISSRYQGAEAGNLLQEARDVFPNTYLAEDLWGLNIPKKTINPQ